MSDETSWRFERTVSLGVVVAVLLQTAAALMWAGSTGERLRYLEEDAAATSPVNERLARLEEQTVQMRATLDRIERRLHDQETGG